MAQAHPLSSRTSFFAAFQSLAAAHTSNRLHHALASPSSKGSGKHIVFPVAIVPGFGTTVTTRKNNPENSHNSVIIKSKMQTHRQKRSRVRSQDTLHAYTINYLSYYTHTYLSFSLSCRLFFSLALDSCSSLLALCCNVPAAPFLSYHSICLCSIPVNFCSCIFDS